MKEASKFTFDTIFSESGEILDAPPKPQLRSYLAMEVEEIRKEAYSEGARSSLAVVDSSFKQLSAAIESLFNVMDKEVEHVRQEAAQLAFVIGSKIAGKLLDNDPTHGIDALIDECLENLRSEPHVHIQVHPQNIDDIGARIQETMNGRAFGGQLHISPSDGLSETDVRIEWTNGGIEKSHREIVAAIAQIIDQKWKTSVLAETGEPDEPSCENEAPAPAAAGALANS